MNVRAFFSLSPFLFIGMSIFLGLWVSSVLMQTDAMGMPRLGDDALVHLWRGEEINVAGILGAHSSEFARKPELLRSINQACSVNQDKRTNVQTAICNRMNARFYAPSSLPTANLIMAFVMKIGLPLKWS